MAGRSGSGSSFGTSDRLHRPSEFSKAMASRTRYSDSCFELRFSVAPSAEGSDTRPRLGLIVPKKFAKHAVLRNLLKRVARESFRTSRAILPAGDIVLRLKSPPLMSEHGLDRATRLAWRQSVDRLFERIAR